jgi:hypothetical protein
MDVSFRLYDHPVRLPERIKMIVSPQHLAGEQTDVAPRGFHNVGQHDTSGLKIMMRHAGNVLQYFL